MNAVLKIECEGFSEIMYMPFDGQPDRFGFAVWDYLDFTFENRRWDARKVFDDFTRKKLLTGYDMFKKVSCISFPPACFVYILNCDERAFVCYRNLHELSSLDKILKENKVCDIPRPDVHNKQKESFRKKAALAFVQGALTSPEMLKTIDTAASIAEVQCRANAREHSERVEITFNKIIADMAADFAVELEKALDKTEGTKNEKKQD